MSDKRKPLKKKKDQAKVPVAAPAIKPAPAAQNGPRPK